MLTKNCITLWCISSFREVYYEIFDLVHDFIDQLYQLLSLCSASQVITVCIVYSGRNEDAYKSFSAAVQQHDTLVKAWAFWGDFIEEQFTKSQNPDIQTGVGAITCFLHACRHQNESKSRKYLAKVIHIFKSLVNRNSIIVPIIMNDHAPFLMLVGCDHMWFSNICIYTVWTNQNYSKKCLIACWIMVERCSWNCGDVKKKSEGISCRNLFKTSFSKN